MTRKLSDIFDTEEYNEFCAAVHTQLLSSSSGLSEHDLIIKLQQQTDFNFMREIFGDTHSLFVAHFILFHCLYNLKHRFFELELYQLDISAMNICLQPYTKTTGDTQSLAHPDPLQDYYLDRRNLDRTDEQQLKQMLDSFWRKLIHNDARPGALATLGLKDPVNDTQIKQAWRKLLMEHHPDRGGDTKTLQKINKAFNLLLG